MARFVRGEVVVVPFPFTDLSDTKNRPAVVLFDPGDSDIVLCQVTSQLVKRDDLSITITSRDFSSGLLRVDSIARVNRLFTFSRSKIVRSCGLLTRNKTEEIVKTLISMVSR
jgi:mRNA interferase MazF